MIWQEQKIRDAVVGKDPTHALTRVLPSDLLDELDKTRDKLQRIEKVARDDGNYQQILSIIKEP